MLTCIREYVEANVGGDNVPKLQLKDEGLAVYPLAQAAMQLLPLLTLELWQDGLAAPEIPLGAGHELGEQDRERRDGATRENDARPTVGESRGRGTSGTTCTLMPKARSDPVGR